MKPGETFNPWRGDCGFNPFGIVCRQRALTDGQKLLYGRLVRFAGRDGYCYPSQVTLADELGKSPRQIVRDVAALERFGLIAVEHNKGRGKANRHTFLWHSCFESWMAGPAEKVTPASPFIQSRREPSMSPFSQEKVTDPTVKGDRSGQEKVTNCHPTKEKNTSTGIQNTLSGVVDGSGASARASAKNPFEEFQAAYPEPKRGVKIESACRAYVGRIHGTPGEHEKLMAGLQRYLDSAQWQRTLAEDPTGRYLPSMEKFIADGLYLDHPPPAAEEPDGYVTADEMSLRRAAELDREYAYLAPEAVNS
jgi:Helix-turn-helix domain